MKIIVSTHVPFSIFHGGEQVRIEKTVAALRIRGVEVEAERWWDDTQSGDIYYFAGRPSPYLVRGVQAKGMPFVFHETLDQTASRSRSALKMQKTLIRILSSAGGSMFNRMGWESYRIADAMCHNVRLENEVAHYLFGASRAHCHAIPVAVDTSAIAELSRPAPDGDYLLSVATIHPRKNSLRVAEAAARAGIRLRFVGKPYSNEDPYFQRFLSKIDGRHAIYDGFCSEEKKRDLYRKARGFVHLSHYESGCIAIQEAAAARLPMLLSDLPWATSEYTGNPNVEFIQATAPIPILAAELTRFFGKSKRLNAPTFNVATWNDVAARYFKLFDSLLERSRR